MTRNSNDQGRPPPDYRKDLLKLFNSVAQRHSPWQVFADFVEASAISISNAVDLQQREKREERYMQIVGRYRRDEIAKLPEMFAQVALALEEEAGDILGRTFHDLELHNKWAGQYFSPYPLCQMMARMTLSDPADLAARITNRGFVTAQEPAVGSGAMVIALADEMKRAGFNYQRHLHVTAVDIDPKCVHMAYVQFSLLHIPAVIVHGNSLSLEEFDHWYTPAHILNGWRWKLRRTEEGNHEIEKPPASPVHCAQSHVLEAHLMVRRSLRLESRRNNSQDEI